MPINMRRKHGAKRFVPLRDQQAFVPGDVRTPFLKFTLQYPKE
jgi:hypothetical protein